MLRRLLDRFAGVQPVVDPNDIGTGIEDVYVMSLDEVLRRLAQNIPADTFLAEGCICTDGHALDGGECETMTCAELGDEDDTANFDNPMDEYPDIAGVPFDWSDTEAER